MPSANGFGTLGVSDFNCVKDSVFMVIETKFGKNRPTALQRNFAAQIIANECLAFCVDQEMLGVLDIFLENFTAAAACQRKNLPVPDDVGARMMNAIDIMTDMWKYSK